MKQEIKDRIENIRADIVPNNYKTQYKIVVPNEWDVKELSSFEVKIGSGKTPKGGERAYQSSGVPFIRSQNVMETKLYLRNVAFISKEIHEAMKSTKILDGDILLNITGASIGRCCIVPESFIEGNLNQHVCIIRTDERIFNKFLLDILKSDIGQDQIMLNQAGGNREGLNFQQIRNFKIPVPPMVEQQKIANILSIWDQTINLKENLIEKKTKQKKGLMQKLLTGELRLPGFNEKWKEVKLEDLFERVTRKNLDGNKNVLTISAQRGLINQEDYFNKSVASSILDNYYLLLKDEFAYNKSYSNGYPMGAIKRLNKYDSGVVTTLYICFALKDDSIVNSDYFEQFFESGLLNRELIQIAHEGGRAHGLLNVSPTDFFNLPIIIPTKEEQDKIALILCCADKEINLLEQELQDLKLQKKGLMQLLLTGIVRVNTEN